MTTSSTGNSHNDGENRIVFSSDNAVEEPSEHKKCCTGFSGNRVAKGYALNSIVRGLVVAANIFLSSSLIYLASEEAGCLDEQREATTCDTKIYGFRPSSLLTNIAAISGILAAFLNPLIGAVVDFTDHRHALGCFVSIAMVIIQAVQIYTVSSTWFIMAILQALVGVLFEIFLVTAYAYLPELALGIGEKKVNNFASKFNMSMYSLEALFIMVIIGISTFMKTDTVLTAQISQGLNAVSLAICLGLAWLRYLPNVQAKRSLPEGKGLFMAGFSQIHSTAKHINFKYKRSLRYFLLAVTFGEAGATAFTVVAVTYMNEVIKMTGTETGVAFLIVLVFTLPGAKLCEWITTKTNVKNCWKLNLLYFAITTIVGAFLMTDENSKMITYVMGGIWGTAFGWFYTAQTSFYALLIPQEQAAEMAGIFSFCTVIIAWIPPMIFTAMNEGGIHMRFGLLHLVFYFVVATAFLSAMPSWEETLEEAHAQSDKAADEEQQEEEN